MPYITAEQRRQVKLRGAQSSGELNFEITQLLKKYLDWKGLRYESINDILGALEGAKLEFYRRIAAPYEESKIKINGDVFL